MLLVEAPAHGDHRPLSWGCRWGGSLLPWPVQRIQKGAKVSESGNELLPREAAVAIARPTIPVLWTWYTFSLQLESPTKRQSLSRSRKERSWYSG
jgi:hypothetical protein